MGALLHWMEALLAACELWKATEEDEFLNAVIMQYNAFVNQFNQVISESALQTRFLPLMRQRPLRHVDKPREFLLRLYHLVERFSGRQEALVCEVIAADGGTHHRGTDTVPTKICETFSLVTRVLNLIPIPAQNAPLP